MNEKLIEAKNYLETYDGRPLRIMEVCGTHTHEIFRLGIRKILSEKIKLISGPGCPVCVTGVGYIDKAVFLAFERNAIICTFGDLIRVPGTEMSLGEAKAKGADVRMVYTQSDAVNIAKENPDKQVVFLSVGFETTTPGACLAVKKAKNENVGNFSLLMSNKTMPNAYEALKNSADAFLYPGHVNAITGTATLEKLKNEGVSGVVTGFTAGELLTALSVTVKNLQKDEPFFENCYPRVVRPEGNIKAQKLMSETLIPCDAEWRGLGIIPGSGVKLNDSYSEFDAEKKLSVPDINGRPNPACRCGDILRGGCLPNECPLYGKICNPLHPVGACMVSSEGACSAYYKYSQI